MTKAIDHLIVIVPGIMGSRLVDADGNEIWGTGAGTIIKSIVRLGRNFDRLRLPDGIGDNDPEDGISAPSMLDLPHMLAKLFGADGYGRLVDWLGSRFVIQSGVAGNLVTFPYDWRLSNRLNAARLEQRVVPALEAWRQTSKKPDAKILFITHSMGGLVARWFIEKRGGRELTHRLITLGTPYRGSIEALTRLSNGFSPKLGPFEIKLSEIVRSLPSAYQLLPTYKCIDTGKGMEPIAGRDVANLETARVADAMQFHADLLEGALQPGGPKIHALKGIDQPTSQSVRATPDGLEAIDAYQGEDFRGDGTVPRMSSHPPEWEDDAYAAVFGQQHATLQSDKNAYRQLYSILTADKLVKFASPTDQLGLVVPDIVLADEQLDVEVSSWAHASGLPLVVTVSNEAGGAPSKKSMNSLGDGRYVARFEPPHRPGQLFVRVESAILNQPLGPLVGLTLVWQTDTKSL